MGWGFDGISVYRIDQNVDETMSNVEQGHTQLLKYFKAVRAPFGILLFVYRPTCIKYQESMAWLASQRDTYTAEPHPHVTERKGLV